MPNNYGSVFNSAEIERFAGIFNESTAGGGYAMKTIGALLAIVLSALAGSTVTDQHLREARRTRLPG